MRAMAVATALAAVCAALAGAPGTALAAGAPAACPAAHAIPSADDGSARSEHALLCLLNRERADAGLRQLEPNRCLARAAAGHARDMVARRYFAHRSPDGRGFAERILATGYAPSGASWTVGENLAWGAAPAGDPAWVIEAWMESRGHRENVLRASFRDVGVAAVPGVPVAAASGSGPRATYAVEFGAVNGRRGRCR